MHPSKTHPQVLSFKASSRPALHAAYTILDRKYALMRDVYEENISIQKRLQSIQKQRSPFSRPEVKVNHTLSVDPRERYRRELLRRTKMIEEENLKIDRRLSEKKSTVGRLFRITPLRLDTKRSHASNAPPKPLIEMLLEGLGEQVFCQVTLSNVPSIRLVKFFVFDNETIICQKHNSVSTYKRFLNSQRGSRR